MTPASSSGAVFASMLAYIAAQYCDVQLFHFWKRVTKGRYLWVRNNFSTLMSQMVDSVMVVTVTFGAAFLAGEITAAALLVPYWLWVSFAAYLNWGFWVLN